MESTDTRVIKHSGIPYAQLKIEISLRIRVGLKPHDTLADALDNDMVGRICSVGQSHITGDINRPLFEIRKSRLLSLRPIRSWNRIARRAAGRRLLSALSATRRCRRRLPTSSVLRKRKQ